MSFVNLSAHSVYSIMQGYDSPESYIDAAKELGHPSITINEIGTMSSVPDCYFAAQKAGIKYVPSCVIPYNDFKSQIRLEQESGTDFYMLQNDDYDYYSRLTNDCRLIAIAKNANGYHDLISLTTTMSGDAGLDRGLCSFDDITHLAGNVIILSGGIDGPIANELYLDIYSRKYFGQPYMRRHGGYDAVHYVSKFRETFNDDFLIESHVLGMPEIYDDHILKMQNVLANRFGINHVITNNCYYLKKSSHKAYRMLCAISQKKLLNDPSIKIRDSDQMYFRGHEEMISYFNEHGYASFMDPGRFNECCNNTSFVIDGCDDFEPDLSSKVPDWSVIEDNVDGDVELRRLVDEALVEKGLYDDPTIHIVDGRKVTYRQQAHLECDRFINKGFASYFLITRDIVKYGKSNGWPFGPRGSAGGSLVCYLLGITSILPQAWSLSFDRFMSAARGGYLLNVTME